MIHILLQVFAQFLEFLSGVRVILAFSLDLFGHIHLIEPNDRLLELLVVGDIVQSIVHLVLELSLLLFLLLEDLAQVTMLSNQPTHSHTQVFYDQTQVHEDSLEVSLLLLHLVGLILEIVDGFASGTNITLQLLNLIVKHKLELLQFLGLLLQVMDPFVLISDRGLSFGQFQGLALNVSLQLIESSDELIQLRLLILDVPCETLLRRLARLIFLCDRRQIRLMLHALVDDLN